MRVIRAIDVNDAFRQACQVIVDEPRHWRRVDPKGRGGATMEFYEPVATVYSYPWRRVLLSEARDANPFFHLMEALWMLAGRDDAEWISEFSSQISRYAEDDGTFHGAYGHRWREHFTESGVNGSIMRIDQLSTATEMLVMDPDTRRVVIGMWDPECDLAADRRDLPCNTHVYLKVREGKLHMTVSCRSNDIILGCYGANAVHFSVLQEYMVARINAMTETKVIVGTYTHVSDSWHYYVDNPLIGRLERGEVDHDSYYKIGMAHSQIRPLALINGPIGTWDTDLSIFMSDSWDDPTQYKDTFFRSVTYPMRDAWQNYRRGDLETALHRAQAIAAQDWRVACVRWIQRRIDRRSEVSE